SGGGPAGGGGGGGSAASAPAAGPRLYGTYYNWDFGFLAVVGDRLCYVGDHARFALRRDQVTAVRLGPGPSRWWYAPYVYVSWRDEERGTAGTLNVRAREGRTMRQLKSPARGPEAGRPPGGGGRGSPGSPSRARSPRRWRNCPRPPPPRWTAPRPAPCSGPRCC